MLVETKQSHQSQLTGSAGSDSNALKLSNDKVNETVDKLFKVSSAKVSLVVGLTQHGKSTLINSLMHLVGIDPSVERAKVGYGSFSTTMDTTLFNITPELSLLDTPGLDDSNGQDEMHIYKLVKHLTKINNIASPMLVIKNHQIINFGAKEKIVLILKIFDKLDLPIFVVHTGWDLLHAVQKPQMKNRIEEINKLILNSGKKACHFFMELCGWENNYILEDFSNDFETAKSKALSELIAFLSASSTCSTKNIQVPKGSNFFRNDELAESCLKISIDIDKISFHPGQKRCSEIMQLSSTIGNLYRLITEAKIELENLEEHPTIDVEIEQLNPGSSNPAICKVTNATGYRFISGPNMKWDETSVIMSDSYISANFEVFEGDPSGALIATRESSKRIEEIKINFEENKEEFNEKVMQLNKLREDAIDLLTEEQLSKWDNYSEEYFREAIGSGLSQSLISLGSIPVNTYLDIRTYYNDSRNILSNLSRYIIEKSELFEIIENGTKL